MKKSEVKVEQKEVLTFRSPFHVIGRVYNSSKLSAENSKQISNKKINKDLDAHLRQFSPIQNDYKPFTNTNEIIQNNS